MQFEVNTLVRGAADRVWAWWTDHGAVGTRERVSHGFVSSTREVLEVDGDVIVLRETFLGIGGVVHRIELHPQRLAFRETGKGFEAWWAFEPAAEWTLVRRQVDLTASIARLAPSALVRWGFQRDLAHHAREYERANLS